MNFKKSYSRERYNNHNWVNYEAYNMFTQQQTARNIYHVPNKALNLCSRQPQIKITDSKIQDYN